MLNHCRLSFLPASLPYCTTSGTTCITQNVLPDESLAPALLDAGNRLLKFLQQRFGLFASGGPARYGPAQAASAGEKHALISGAIGRRKQILK